MFYCATSNELFSAILINEEVLRPKSAEREANRPVEMREEALDGREAVFKELKRVFGKSLEELLQLADSLKSKSNQEKKLANIELLFS